MVNRPTCSLNCMCVLMEELDCPCGLYKVLTCDVIVTDYTCPFFYKRLYSSNLISKTKITLLTVATTSFHYLCNLVILASKGRGQGPTWSTMAITSSLNDNWSIIVGSGWWGSNIITR